MQDLIGKSLGNYQLNRLLNQSGSIATFKSYHQVQHQEVVLKVKQVDFDLPSYLEQNFRQTGKKLAQMTPAGLVSVVDLGYIDTFLYLATEFIAAPNLRHHLHHLKAKNECLPLARSLTLTYHLSLVLQEAHERGLIHGDIKPQNILLKPPIRESDPDQPILTDLGVSQLFERGLLDIVEAPLNTLAYIAPELTQGQRHDSQSDIYSLGILLYELSVGQLPFPIQTLSQAIHYHTQERPLAPKSLRPDLPDALEALILRTLAKAPPDRFASMQDLAYSLADLIEPEQGLGPLEPEEVESPLLNPTLPFIPDAVVPATLLPKPENKPIEGGQTKSGPVVSSVYSSPVNNPSPPISTATTSTREVFLAPHPADPTQARQVYQVMGELYPTRLKTGKLGQISLYNRSETVQTIQIVWNDAENNVRFQPPKLIVNVPEQTRVNVNFRAKVRQRPWLGNEIFYPFSAQVAIPDRESQTLQGDILSSGRISIWLLIVPISMGIGLVAALLTVYGANLMEMIVK